MQYDFILRGGRVMDPANGLDEVTDIAVADGRIAAVGDITGNGHVREWDVRGCMVTPGLIDIHGHVIPLSTFGVHADSVCFPYGVTGIADGGGCGAARYETARPALAFLRSGVKVFLNVAATGLDTFDEDITPEHIPEAQIMQLFRKYPEELAGLKIRVGRETTKGQGLRPLAAACSLGAKLQKPVMVHCTNPEEPMSVLLGILQTGDIATHVYHGDGHTIACEDGLSAALDAKKRGVIFDSGDANGFHFSFEVFRKALELGLTPDVISTDMTRDYIMNTHTHVLPSVMARMEAFGLSRMEVLRAVTCTPAKILGFADGTGTLTPGARADIAVWRDIPVDKTNYDRFGGSVTIRHLPSCVLTLLAGQPVWRAVDF